MMKCNVFEMKINYNLLNESIDIYKKDTEKNPNYLIMNYKTFSKIRWDGISEVSAIMNCTDRKEYHGIPIAITEHLEDGDINIV